MKWLAVEEIMVQGDVGAVEVLYEPACKREIGLT